MSQKIHLDFLVASLKEYLALSEQNPNRDTELEIRFGKFENGQFNTNVGKEFIDKVNNNLHSFYWKDLRETKFTQIKQNGVRYRIDSNGKVFEAIRKRKLRTMNLSFVDHPLSMRISLSDETQQPIPENFEVASNAEVFNITRTSFQRELFAIDLSSIHFRHQNLYQQEIEIAKIKLNDRLQTFLAESIVNEIIVLLKLAKQIDVPRLEISSVS